MREFLCVSTQKGLKYLDLTTGSQLSRVEETVHTFSQGVFSIGNSGHIKSSLVGCLDPNKPLLRLYKLDKLKAALKRFMLPEAGTCGDVSSDGVLLAVGSQSGRVHIWDLSSGKYLRCLMVFPEKISQVAFCGPYLLIVRGSTIYVYNISDLVGFSAIGDGSIMGTLSPLVTFCGHVHSVIACESFSGMGCEGYIVSADNAGTVHIWDIRTGDTLGMLDLDCPKCGILIDDVIPTKFYVALQRGESSILVVDCCIPKIIKYYERNRTPVYLESPDNSKEGILKTLVVLQRSVSVADRQEKNTAVGISKFPFLMSLNGKHNRLVLACGDELVAISLENASIAYKLAFNPCDAVTSIFTLCEYPGVKELTQKIHPVRYLGSHDDQQLAATLDHRNVESSLVHLAHVPLGVLSDCLWRHAWTQGTNAALGTSVAHAIVTRLWKEFLSCQNEQHVIRQDHLRATDLESVIKRTSNLLDDLIRQSFARNGGEKNASITDADGDCSGIARTKPLGNHSNSADDVTRSLVHCACAVSRGGAESETVLAPAQSVISVLNSQPSCYSRPPMNWIFSTNINSNLQLNC